MHRLGSLGVALVAVLTLACEDEPAPVGNAGAAGAPSGAAGAGGAGARAGAGAGAAAGSGAGRAGASGEAAAGEAGAGGQAGTAGHAGAGGDGGSTSGADAGTGGLAGNTGTGGVAGNSGTGGLAGNTGTGGLAGNAGAAGSAVCGDGARSSPEICDGADLGGATCTSLGVGGLPRGPDRLPLASAGPGHASCTASCEIDKSLCEPPFQSIGYVLGPTEGTPGRFDFSENFGWDAAARVYRTTGVSFTVTLPAGAPPVGPTLLLTTGSGDDRATLPGFVPPDYPSLHVAEPTFGMPFYEPCWDHDCVSAPSVAPYPPRTERRVPLLLRQTTGTAHVPGSGRPWLAGRGKLRLVVAVVYADEPMPAADVASLFAAEGGASGSSLAAVPPWFAARSAERALPKGVDLEVVWSGKQVKIPDNQIPGSYDACISADWKPLVAPSVALEPNDALVQLYWGKPGTPCASHVLRGSQSFVLFARPDFFQLPGLVVSAAHELMHLFGASDKYTETALPDAMGKRHGCWFEGDSSYDAHDIMCHRVLDPSGTGFANPPLPELGVWPLTAREIGWEDLDGDGTIEVEDACPWDGGC